jgi:hypothetical protein
MCIVVVDVDIRSVQEWWLPRAVSPSWSDLVYFEREDGRVEWDGVFVCLLYYYWLWLVYIYGVGVFAEGRSDVLGSGGRGSAPVRARKQKSVWRRRYGRREVKRAASSSGGRWEASDESLR